MLPSTLPRLALLASLTTTCVNALKVDVSNADSIKQTAKTVATDLMNYYTGWHPGDNPGNLPPPYYWWEAGGMFGHMVDYWYYTGDDYWNDNVTQAITWQAGKDGTFMPQNQTRSEGNDDQVFWAFTAMDAAELNFPAPSKDYPSWVAMGQGAFQLMSERWDDKACGGGLRWQIFQWNAGYDYKNVASNGGFFQLAARLARYTGNDTYTHWAEKSWNWFSDSVLYDAKTFQVYDGTSDTNNCTSAGKSPWTYNYGLYLNGLAYLHNATGDDKWLPHIKGILNTLLATFFPPKMGNKIFVEVNCEPFGNCDTDNYTFKGFTIRWLATIAQLVPEVADQIWPYIQASGAGAAGQCSGGAGGTHCGFEWNTTTWDGTQGVGQQMSALAAINANMIKVANLAPPHSLKSGGESKTDPNAGSGGTNDNPVDLIYTRKITTSDKAGAGIITAMCLAFMVFGAYWLIATPE